MILRTEKGIGRAVGKFVAYFGVFNDDLAFRRNKGNGPVIQLVAINRMGLRAPMFILAWNTQSNSKNEESNEKNQLNCRPFLHGRRTCFNVLCITD